jgi:hypothetical protein
MEALLPPTAALPRDAVQTAEQSACKQEDK